MIAHFSAISLLLLYVGFLSRRNRMRHVTFQMTSLACDIAIVIILESNRSVVQKAIGSTDRLLLTHIALAVTALLQHLLNLITGILIWRTGTGRKIHKLNGLILIVVRTLVTVTAYTVVMR